MPPLLSFARVLRSLHGRERQPSQGPAVGRRDGLPDFAAKRRLQGHTRKMVLDQVPHQFARQFRDHAQLSVQHPHHVPVVQRQLRPQRPVYVRHDHERPLGGE
jgi:hypothetical protein